MFWKFVVRWALIAVAIPLLAAVVRAISESMERRKGSTRTSSVLRQAADALSSRDAHRQLTASP
ncbi:hypothetical protein GCM10009682_46960 [Luedemannella flava]|uniref:Uncharacterized protein n=1 Tax=Luedemannella flava TaxID=349316 RepID=A0ABP4YNA7_9ACTN